MMKDSKDSMPSKKHPYHLIDPSPWPLVGGLSAFILAVGGVLYMHHYGWWVLALGTGLTAFTMIGWWRDMLKESTPDNHTPVVRVTLRHGIALFIVSELMLFVSFFWAYFNASLFPAEATGGIWPPKGIDPLDPLRLPYLNTLLLLLSGTTVTWAHHSLLHGRQKEMVQGLGLTVLLGIIFLGVQSFEYHHASFAFKGGIYPSTFYMATGFHGFHVLIGTIFLGVCWWRARKGDYSVEHHIGFEAAAWYWHFVDVVWLFLFVSIYLLGYRIPAVIA